MKIGPGETSDRDVRQVSAARSSTPRQAAARAARVDDLVSTDAQLPRTIARSQMVVAGLRQLFDTLARDEVADVDALVAAVSFEGEPVLTPHTAELAEIGRTHDTPRLQRLIDNTESNVLALLVRTGVRRPEELLSGTDGRPSPEQLLARTIAGLNRNAVEVSAIRPERVAELL